MSENNEKRNWMWASIIQISLAAIVFFYQYLFGRVFASFLIEAFIFYVPALISLSVFLYHEFSGRRRGSAG